MKETQLKPYYSLGNEYPKSRLSEAHGPYESQVYAVVIYDYPVGGVAFIADFYVSPDLRREGFGTGFYSRIRRKLKAKGYSRVALRTAVTDEARGSLGNTRH